MNRGLFISGTDTNIGKTIVSAWLMTHFQCSYWKPIQAGEPTDLAIIKDINPNFITYEEEYKLSFALSPHLAASLDHIDINLEKIVATARRKLHLASSFLVGFDSSTLSNRASGVMPFEEEIAENDPERDVAQSIIVEGVGGILSPINAEECVADLISSLGLPTIIVSHGRLGAINQAAMAALSAKHYDLNVLGIIISGEVLEGNIEGIEHFAGVPILATIPSLDLFSYEKIITIALADKLIKAMEKIGISLRNI